MWNDLVFDTAGNLYVPDDKPRIWRVAPDGTASIWFTDPRLTGFFGFAGGPLGGRIDPTGKWLYFSITVAAERAADVRDLPGPAGRPSDGRRPRAGPRFPFDPTAPAPPQATGLAFAQVGQPLRQPHRPEPDRGPRSGRQRDRPDLGPAVPLAVGPRVHGQVAAGHERRPRAGRQPRRLEDLQGLRRRDGPAAQSTEDAGRLTGPPSDA